MSRLMRTCRSTMYRYVGVRASYHCDHTDDVSQRWTGRFFESVTLQSMGLVLQLGHSPGERCAAPVVGPRSFVVMHTNGFHPVTVQFCQCDHLRTAGTHVQQLLRHELYPATLEDPSTCATFRLMETFHMLTLQSKVTAYDFYLALQKLTDRLGIKKPFVRIPADFAVLR